MIDLPEYKTLNDRTKMDVEDRLCSGWGIFHKELAKRFEISLEFLN